MLFVCNFCEWEHETDFPDMPLSDLTLISSYSYPTHCPSCGAVVEPEDINPDEYAGWYHLWSKCPNAGACRHEKAYRSECEKLIFYPGCLRFVWQEMYKLNLTLRYVHRVEEPEIYTKNVR